MNKLWRILKWGIFSNSSRLLICCLMKLKIMRFRHLRTKLLIKIIIVAIYLKYIWMIKIVWLNKSNKQQDFSILLLLKNKLIVKLRKRVIISNSYNSKLFLIPHQHSKIRIIILLAVNCLNMKSAKICFKKPTLLDYLH